MAGWRIAGAALLACAASVAAPRPSLAQGDGMTVAQKVKLEEKSEPFCTVFADEISGKKPWPPEGSVRIRPAGDGYAIASPDDRLAFPYSAEEVRDLKKRCPEIMERIRKKRGLS